VTHTKALKLTGLTIWALVTLALTAHALEWTTFYFHEYVYAGYKFAGPFEAGCGVEWPTQAGRELGLTVFYCE
jgi:ferritin-like protein